MNPVRPWRAALRRSAFGAVALSTGAVVAIGTAGPAVAVEGESPQERVLQSVDVQLAPDGTMTTIDGTVIRGESADGDDAESEATEYAPNEVAGGLPIRVMTSWRTEDGTGTDLADVEGYDGKVRIDLTVQNLTVKPEILEYDSRGVERKQAALVGAPMTVVAAADLGDTPSEAVVTQGNQDDDEATNGVLGKGTEDDNTQVQWASILAPPQLGSAARFTLVVDGKDFQVPDLDVSAQPGLVTDPSLGGLVDSAFNPKSSDAMALQTRTIDVIGNVNGVLAEASGTISEVREILSGSADTIGEQTVADLQGSTETVAQSMEGLSSTLEALNGDVASSLQETGDSSLAELETAVSTVDTILGDTRQPVPDIRVDDNGCKSVVPQPGQQDSVFGNLLVVASQLSAYADATGNCKEALRRTIVDTLGPDKPTAESCPEVEEVTTEEEDEDGNTSTTTSYTRGDSVTCSFYSADLTYGQIATDLRGATDKALALLDTDLYKEALAASSEITGLTERVKDITGKLNTGRIFVADVIVESELYTRDYDPEDPDPQINESAIAIKIEEIRENLRTVHDDANAVLTQVQGMQTKASDAITSLCAFRESSDGTLTDEQKVAFNTALGHLRRTDCDGNGIELAEGATPLQERFDEPISTLQKIAADTKPEGGQQGAGAALERINELRNRMNDRLNEALSYRGQPGEPSLQDLQDELNRVLYGGRNPDTGEYERGMTQALRDFETAVEELDKKSDDLPNIKADIYAAIKDAEDKLDKSVTDGIEQVNKSKKDSTGQLDSLFTNSTKGMREAANQVVSNGRTSLGDQKAEFTRAQQEAARRIAAEIGSGLESINEGVSASTRQMDAAGALLTADLRKVLLDLGERRVDGGGLLGAMKTSAVTAGAADYQLNQATNQARSYANVRAADIGGILLRQEQANEAMRILADLPAFELDLAAGTLHRTVYNYRIGDGQ